MAFQCKKSEIERTWWCARRQQRGNRAERPHHHHRRPPRRLLRPQPYPPRVLPVPTASASLRRAVCASFRRGRIFVCLVRSRARRLSGIQGCTQLGAVLWYSRRKGHLGCFKRHLRRLEGAKARQKTLLVAWIWVPGSCNRRAPSQTRKTVYPH